MKKNNKGFMLAEVVITSTVVMTAMISLYFTYNKLHNRYNTIMTYKNIDGMYALEKLVDNMIEDGSLNKIISDNREIIRSDKVSCTEIITDNYCQDIIATYNVNNIKIIPKNTNDINNLKKNVNNQTFKDYLTYLTKYYNFDNTEGKYLIIMEYKNSSKEEDKYNYSSKEEDKYNYSSMELG